MVEEEHVELARRLRDLRPWVRLHYDTYRERRDFFEKLVEETLK
jgi:Sirohaem synthase dimerisation region